MAEENRNFLTSQTFSLFGSSLVQYALLWFVTLGMLIFGPITELMRIEWLLVITGGLVLVQVLSVMRNKKLIDAGVTKTLGTIHQSDDVQQTGIPFADR